MDIIYGDVFKEHDTGAHPENAKRLSLTLEYMKERGIKAVKPKNGEKYLHLAHNPEYIRHVKELCKNNQSFYIDPDTPAGGKSYEAACHAAGAVIQASEKNGFALVRPPGHHATRDRGMGFCIFNNLAIAAKKLSAKNRVFIFDFDVHHGNGTQDIVEGDDNILYVSIHQSPLYPGTGLMDKKNAVNIPMPPGTGDEEYIKVLENRVAHLLSEFNPDYVAVSAGFDGDIKDTGFVAGNSFKLTERSYEKISTIFSDYRTFYSLEGGYNPESILDGLRSIAKI